MTDPPRLLDQASTDPSSLALLRSLEVPAAPPPAVQAALAKELSTMVVATGAKAAAGLFWLKTLSVVAIAASGAGGVYWLSTRSSAELPHAQAVVRVEPRAAAEAPPASSAAAPKPAAPVLEPEGPALEEPKRASATPPRDTLAEEEALLEAARRAAGHDPARALALLQRHRTQFPRGQLGAERLFLSIECYRRLGNLPAARREAEALAKSYPNSTYARKASSLLGSTAP